MEEAQFILAPGVEPNEAPLIAALNAYNQMSPKEGRDYLPQSLAARMIMTTNIREWRYIIGLRGDPNDNPSTIELRNKIFAVLKYNYTFFFPDGSDPDNPMNIRNEWDKKNGSIATL
jgi:hypothetical protein